jgi:hypothetical protein
MTYREGQIADHRCLGRLSVPSGLLQVGAIALAVAIVAVLVMLAAQNGQGRKRGAWSVGAYVLVMAPLLVTSGVLYATVPQPGPMAHAACIGDDALSEESP